MDGTDKITRVLILFYRLSRGEKINKASFSIEHNVTERSVDRDIEDIRLFLSEIYASTELIFDKFKSVYYINGFHHTEFSGVEISAILKILISSRAFREDEMLGLINGICSIVEQNKQKQILEIVRNEVLNYNPPRHNKAIMKIQWDLNQCIMKQKKIKLSYFNASGKKIERVVSPVSVVFDNLYFYLIAFIDNKSYDNPAFYRIDRIDSFSILDEKCSSDIYNKYNIGEMRKCVKFMSTGELIDVKIKINASVMENILDQLPNATIIDRDENFIYVKAVVFKDGFIMWVLKQRNNVEILEPLELRKDIKKEIINMLKTYDECEDNSNGKKN